MWQWVQGSTLGYELRDSSLPAYQIMNAAGYRIVSTQSASNKNIGWLWTAMTSTKDSLGNITLKLSSSPFLDNKTRHELDIVMPFTIKEVRVESKYWINVDDTKLFYGKLSNSTEELEVIEGAYNTSVPRISSVSSTSTDILNATYDPMSKNVALILDGAFTTNISINDFDKPFSTGTTTINSSGNSILSTNLTGETAINSVNMSIAPASDSIGVTINVWNTSSDHYKEWREGGATHDINIAHIVGDLSPNVQYRVKVNGDIYNTYYSNSSGQISFNYTGGYSERVFVLETAP
jgi:hypothetical protein